MEEDDRLSKLDETGDFITCGHHFDLFKDNFRAFLRTEPQNAPPKVSTGDQFSSDELPIHGLSSTEYTISSTISSMSLLSDICKRYVECAAGAQLSWWPLSNPEDPLREDYVRIYSMKFVSKSLPFNCKCLVLKSVHRDVHGSLTTFQHRWRVRSSLNSKLQTTAGTNAFQSSCAERR
jgi:hypothetical protein